MHSVSLTAVIMARNFEDVLLTSCYWIDHHQLITLRRKGEREGEKERREGG